MRFFLRPAECAPPPLFAIPENASPFSSRRTYSRRSPPLSAWRVFPFVSTVLIAYEGLFSFFFFEDATQFLSVHTVSGSGSFFFLCKKACRYSSFLLFVLGTFGERRNSFERTKGESLPHAVGLIRVIFFPSAEALTDRSIFLFSAAADSSHSFSTRLLDESFSFPFPSAGRRVSFFFLSLRKAFMQDLSPSGRRTEDPLFSELAVSRVYAIELFPFLLCASRCRYAGAGTRLALFSWQENPAAHSTLPFCAFSPFLACVD